MKCNKDNLRAANQSLNATPRTARVSSNVSCYMRTTIILVAMIIALSSAGCMAIRTRFDPDCWPEGKLPAFSGTWGDIRGSTLISYPFWGIELYPISKLGGFGLGILFLLDLPLSIAADVMFLPYDMYIILSEIIKTNESGKNGQSNKESINK